MTLLTGAADEASIRLLFDQEGDRRKTAALTFIKCGWMNNAASEQPQSFRADLNHWDDFADNLALSLGAPDDGSQQDPAAGCSQ